MAQDHVAVKEPMPVVAMPMSGQLVRLQYEVRTAAIGTVWMKEKMYSISWCTELEEPICSAYMRSLKEAES
jgi:hypothetical protein